MSIVVVVVVVVEVITIKMTITEMKGVGGVAALIVTKFPCINTCCPLHCHLLKCTLSL